MVHGLSGWDTQTPAWGSQKPARGLSCFAACGIFRSPLRNGVHNPCIARWTLLPLSTGEVPRIIFQFCLGKHLFGKSTAQRLEKTSGR